MAIKEDTYYYNGVDLSSVCESDSLGGIYTPSYLNNMSYPRLINSSAAPCGKKYSTEIYQDGEAIEFPKIGYYPSLNSKLLYDGEVTNNLIIRKSSSDTIVIGSSVTHSTEFYKNTLPHVLLLMIQGAGGAGPGARSTVTAGGGGGSGACLWRIIDLDSYDSYVVIPGARGTTTQLSVGYYTNGGGTTYLKARRNPNGSWNVDLNEIGGGGGGGMTTGGGGGGSSGSYPTGTTLGGSARSGGKGGNGGGTQTSAADGQSIDTDYVSIYARSTYGKIYSRKGGFRGSGDYPGGGGGASYMNTGGSGGDKGGDGHPGARGSGGGGGGATASIFVYSTNGADGGNAYVRVYGGYSK